MNCFLTIAFDIAVLCTLFRNTRPKLEPALSPNGAELDGEQPRLFDEFNDDDDDDDGNGFGAAGGSENGGAKVVLVAPSRSPAVPLAPAGTAGCCGGPTTRSSAAAAAAAKGESSGAAAEGGGEEDTPANRPFPVLAGGWVGAGAGRSVVWRRRQARRDLEDERRYEEAHARRAAAAAAAGEGGEESLLDTGQRVDSGTEARRVSCVCVCVSRWASVSIPGVGICAWCESVDH